MIPMLQAALNGAQTGDKHPGICSRTLRMSMLASFRVATAGQEKPRPAVAGGVRGGRGGGVVVSLSLPPR